MRSGAAGGPTDMTQNIDQRFTAVLQKSPAQGGWTYVVWPPSAEFFGTHKLPVRAEIRRAIGKEAGATVEVRLEERLA